MIGVIASLALLGQAALPPLPKPGDKLTVHAPFETWAPLLTDEDAYQTYIRAVRAQNLKMIRTLSWEEMKAVPNGAQAIVFSVVEQGTDKGVKAQAFPQNVAAVIAKFPELEGHSEDLFWVPCFYLWPDGSPPHPALTKFPVIIVAPDKDVVPVAGMKMLLWAENTDIVPVAKDVFGFEAMVKVMLAGDKKGVEELVESRKLAAIPILTEVLVIERHQNEFIAKGISAAEVRILSGPFKDKTCWVPSTYTTILEVNAIPFKEAEAKLGGKRIEPRPQTDKAQSALNLARNLERSKKFDAAIRAYRQVVRDYPKSAEAKTAKERIKALEAK